MATIPVSGNNRSTWHTIRIANLGAVAGVASILELDQDSQIQSVLLVTEGVAVRVSTWQGMADGVAIPTDAYIVIPANNALRIPVRSNTSQKDSLQKVAVAGDAANAPLGIVPEYGDLDDDPA